MLVLLIDHDTDTRRMYAEYLEFKRWRTEEAADGREGLAKALTRHPQIIVTETRLPGISGYDLCGLLRQDDATKKTPIVILTGDTFTADLDRARQAGADTVMTKPCLPDQLFDEIKRLARRGTTVPALDGIPARMRKASLKDPGLPRDTAAPSVAPPALLCPNCDRLLVYERSHVGGIRGRATEQWDYFKCPGGCGTFQYRSRTRKLRRIS